MLVYIDNDRNLPNLDGVFYLHGERIGPVASYNAMVRERPGYDVYGAITDDCTFETKGWDNWIREKASGITAIAPYVRDSGRMDFPWCTREWIETVGYFALPRCYHYYWDVAMEVLGQLSRIVYAGQYDFRIDHHGEPISAQPVTVLQDAIETIHWLIWNRPAQVSKLRKALSLEPLDEQIPEWIMAGYAPSISKLPAELIDG